MLYKAKQLHLLIMRGLAQDGHRDYDGKTAQQHLSMAVAPAWGQGFSNGAFRKHLWYHRNPGRGRKLSCCVQASLWMLFFCCLCFIQPQ